MAVRKFINEDDLVRIFSDTEKIQQQIYDFYVKLFGIRFFSLLRQYEICMKNLSELEEQLAQGQNDIQIHNQIDAIKQEIVRIELEIKGKQGTLLEIHKLFCEILLKYLQLPSLN